MVRQDGTLTLASSIRTEGDDATDGWLTHCTAGIAAAVPLPADLDLAAALEAVPRAFSPWLVQQWEQGAFDPA